MLFINTTKLLLNDLKSSPWKVVVYFLLLLATLIYYANFTTFINRKTSIPDIFNLLFRDFSLTFIVIPVFLLLLSLLIPPIFDSLRIIRYKSRGNIAFVLFLSIGGFVLLFLFIYMLTGFLYGWWLTGTLENIWATELGAPYILSDGAVDLSLYSTGYIFLRFVITEILVFITLGLLATLIYLLSTRFIYAFFITVAIVIVDMSLYSTFPFSIFIDKATVSIGNWGDFDYFIFILSYFSGAILVLGVIIYLIIDRTDFLPALEETTWEN